MKRLRKVIFIIVAIMAMGMILAACSRDDDDNDMDDPITRSDLATMVAGGGFNFDSETDEGTCVKGDYEVNSTRGFCDSIDGKFTVNSASSGSANPVDPTPEVEEADNVTFNKETPVTTGSQNIEVQSPTEVVVEQSEDQVEEVDTHVPTENDADNWGGNTGAMPELPVELSHSKWEIHANDAIENDPIVLARLRALMNPDPTRWRTFPNVPNPDIAEFDVANGAEYGVANVPFCQQDTRCDFVVPAWHYRLITADYEFQGQSCRGEEGNGCLLLLINVGEVTHTWRDQVADNGFTVPGRYWNGDQLEWAIQGLVSHASANMLNMPTLANENGEVLNAGTTGNAGANCGVPDGCPSVDALVVIHAGDRILATAHTVVTRP